MREVYLFMKNARVALRSCFEFSTSFFSALFSPFHLQYSLYSAAMRLKLQAKIIKKIAIK